jgi:hypothetical protein
LTTFPKKVKSEICGVLAYHTFPIQLEAVSKPQIRFKGKAQTDEKAQHTQEYVSILRRLATQPLGLRWGFETTSSIL